MSGEDARYLAIEQAALRVVQERPDDLVVLRHDSELRKSMLSLSLAQADDGVVAAAAIDVLHWFTDIDAFYGAFDEW